MTTKESTITELVDSFKRDLDLLGNARVMSFDEIYKLMLNEDVKWKGMAESFICAQMKIPYSYYKNALASHKEEILINAKNLHAGARFSILKSGKDVLAAGPAEIEDQKSFIENIMKGENRVFSIYGDFFKSGIVITYDLGNKEVFTNGVVLGIYPLFCRGFSVYPGILELVCTNGLVDVRPTGVKFSLKATDCKKDVLPSAYEAACEISRKRESQYQAIVDHYSKMDPILPVEVGKVFESEAYPKSFIEKVVATTTIVKEGKGSLGLPKNLSNRMNNWSIATWVAKEFSVGSRSRLEIKIMSTMLKGMKK